MKGVLLALYLVTCVSLMAQIVPVTNVTSGSSHVTISDAVANAAAGDVLQLAATTFQERVNLSQPLTLLGDPNGGTLIDVTQDIGWGITIGSSHVTVKDITVLAGGDNPHFAIHSEPGITGMTIEDVAVYDPDRSCIDLNGLTGPDLNVIRNVDVVGSAIGFGVALSTCDHVLLENVYSRDNGFGDIAIMESNYYDQEISSITIMGDLDLGGPQTLGGGGIVVQIDPAILPVGIGPGFPLNIQAAGFEQVIEAPGDLTGCIVVHNDDVRQVAATLGGAISDLISFDLNTQQGMVYPGMRIQAAVDAASDGGVVHIEAGVYDTIPVVIDKDITLMGANSGIPADSAALRAEETNIMGIVVAGGQPILDGIRVSTTSGSAMALADTAVGLTVRNSILRGDQVAGTSGIVAHGLVLSEDNRISRFQEGILQQSGSLTVTRNRFQANGDGIRLSTTASTSSVVTASDFENAGGQGLHVSQSGPGSSIEVTQSNFNLHAKGIQLESDVDLTLSDNVFLNSEVQIDGSTTSEKLGYCAANTFEPAMRIPGCTDANAANFEACANITFGCEYPGCTSPKACNYDSGANVDDGSCDFITCAGCPLGFACNYDPNADLYKVEACDFSDCEGEGMAAGGVDREGLVMTSGCTIQQACNYDPEATIFDNSCTFDCFGCLDADACNYDDTFTQASNETCLYKADLFPSPNVDCEGVCYNDANNNGVCDEEEVSGCMDFTACNFSAEATLDDGNCDFLSCAGCVNASACNFDSEATIPDESCDYDSCKGCTSPDACNTTSEATIDDGSCAFPVDIYNKTYVDCDGGCLNDVNANGVCDEVEIPGCMDQGACNYEEAATMDDGSCDFESCAGCTDPSYCNYDPGATIDNGQCQSPGDLFPESIVDGVSVVDCVGRCLNDADGDDICDELEIPGCQDEAACNYNADASDPGACTYAELEYDCDGNCLEDADGDGVCDAFEPPCFGDLDGNGVRGASDILVLLSSFGCYSNCGDADLDGDGLVGASDILSALVTFGVPCPQ